MKLSLKAILGATAAVALAGAAAGSLAQDAPAGPSRGGQGLRGAPPSPEMREQMMTQHLGLRADQAPALRTFLAATGREAGRADRRDMRSLTTPERLDRQLEDLRRRADATKRFYAQLTPEQRTAFDSMPMMGMGGPGGRGRGGPDGGPGGRHGPGGGPNQGFGAPPSPR